MRKHIVLTILVLSSVALAAQTSIGTFRRRRCIDCLRCN